jgi:ribonucleoside-diphosphate reductase alpha chain
MAANSAPSPAMSRTPSTCCASSATIAAPPWRRPTATRSCRSAPVPLDHAELPQAEGLVAHAKARLGRALELGESNGYRNAQVTVIAPTGTIGLVMDCDTTGIEPDFALVKFKKLAGGGYFKIINRGAGSAAHARLSPKPDRRDRGLCGRPRLAEPGARHQPSTLRAKGFTDEASRRSRSAATAFDIKFVFNKWTLGEDFLHRSCSEVRRRRS